MYLLVSPYRVSDIDIPWVHIEEHLGWFIVLLEFSLHWLHATLLHVKHTIPKPSFPKNPRAVTPRRLHVGYTSVTRRLNVGYVGYRRNGYRCNGHTSVTRRLHVRYVGYDLDILAARVFGK